MPSTVTHAYFSMDVYDRLPLSRKMFLKNEIDNIKIYSQSVDPLYFYVTFNIKKSNKVRHFADYFHSHNTNDFFINLINYIKYNYYKDDPSVIAYLYGMIMHYVLDSNMHPYICYKTGEFNKHDKKTYIYNNKHHIFETAFDQHLIALREKTIPKNYHHYKLLKFNGNPSKSLLEVINFTFKETFNISNFTNEYFISVKKMKFFFKILRFDKYGIKNKLYCFVDKISPSGFFKFSFLSYSSNNWNSNFLNLKHKVWMNPACKKNKSKNSFNDLYIYSIKECLETIKNVEKYLYQNEEIDLSKVFKNRSYKTGLDLDLPQKMKYFEK